MPTRAQLEEGIRRADAAGDADAVRVLGQQLLRMRSQPQGQQKPRNPGFGIPLLDKVVSSANEALVGIPQGIENIGAFFTDPLVRMVGGKQVLEDERKRRAGRWDTASRAIVSKPDPTARAVGQMTGAMLVPVPKIPVGGLLARTANRAAAGAMGGAAVRDSDQGAAEPATIGAVANMVLPPVVSKILQTAPMKAAGRAVSKAGAPLLSAADDAAEAVLSRAGPKLGFNYAPLPPNAPLRAPAPSATPLSALGPQAEARAANLKAAGVQNPTTGIVTRDPRLWNFEREQAKVHGTGDDLARQMIAVEQDLTKSAQGLVGRFGGSVSAEDAGSAVQKALDAKQTEMQKVTSGLYKQVRETQGDAAVGAPSWLMRRIDQPDIMDNPTFDTMREGVMRSFKRFGIAGESGLPRKDAVLTVSQAEELRKMIGQLGNGTDPSVKYMRGELINALDDDVVEGLGNDAFKVARASAKARFDEFSKTFAGKVAKEAIPVEQLNNRIMSAGTSLKDLRAFRQSLQTGTPEQIERGAEAWKALQARQLDDLFFGDNAITPDGGINGGLLWRKFTKASPKLREILGPEDFKATMNLVQAARDATVAPPMANINYSNSASAIGNLLQRIPEQPKAGILKMLAKHGIALAGGTAAGVGPAGNIALYAGERAAASRAQQAAAEALMRNISMAQNPAEAAAAMQALQQEAASNPVAAELAKQFPWLNTGALFGGGANAALTAQQAP